MKVWIVYITLFVFGFISFAFALNSVPRPEEAILGVWQGQEWEYERVDKLKNKVEGDDFSNNVKEQIGKHLVIHIAETWHFLPDGTLLLRGDNKEIAVNWCLKGRGNILELKYNDNMTEHYNITELNRHKMILNFNSDMQIKGIAKLTFEKI